MNALLYAAAQQKHKDDASFQAYIARVRAESPFNGFDTAVKPSGKAAAVAEPDGDNAVPTADEVEEFLEFAKAKGAELAEQAMADLRASEEAVQKSLDEGKAADAKLASAMDDIRKSMESTQDSIDRVASIQAKVSDEIDKVEKVNEALDAGTGTPEAMKAAMEAAMAKTNGDKS